MECWDVQWVNLACHTRGACDACDPGTKHDFVLLVYWAMVISRSREDKGRAHDMNVLAEAIQWVSDDVWSVCKLLSMTVKHSRKA